MKTDAFIEEMLEEVKNLKDLAKEELPEIVKEYIFAQKVQNWLGLGVGLFLLTICASSGLYATLHEFSDKYDDTKFALFMISLLSGIVGAIFTAGCISDLINFYLQPRRMAIKAITSLKG